MLVENNMGMSEHWTDFIFDSIYFFKSLLFMLNIPFFSYLLLGIHYQECLSEEHAIYKIGYFRSRFYNDMVPCVLTEP